MSSCLLKSICLLSYQNSGARYVGYKKMPGWFQNFSACLGNTLTKNCWRISRKLCVLCQQWLLAHLNILSRALICFFNNSWDYLFYRRTHYPMLEKLGIKNLALCENQGKQQKSRVMKKSREGMIQKRQDWLINKFQQKILHKKKKEIQLVKPINYWGIPASAQSS